MTVIIGRRGNEHPGLAARLGNIAGKPIELVGRALPEDLHRDNQSAAVAPALPAGHAALPHRSMRRPTHGHSSPGPGSNPSRQS